MATDIHTEKQIFRITQPWLHPYIKLARLDRPIGTWLLLLPCWWGAVLASRGFGHMELQSWTYMMLFPLGAILMRGAGCVINDLWDRKLDAQVERTKTRPLASGEVSPRQALVSLALLLIPSFLILIIFNRLTIYLGLASLVLVVTYPFMKRITWWPQAFLGLTFNWGALIGWTAIARELGSPAVFIYAGGIFWTLAYDTIYAHQDKEDDAIVGVKSTARLLGDKSKRFVGVCFFIALVFFGVGKFLAAPSELTPFLLALPVAHAYWQLKTWNMDDPESCLRIFRSNRDFGLLVLLMFGF